MASSQTIMLSIETLLLLAAIAVLAGFIDTLAGGGGLIALPALLAAGVPPLSALGTNKLQGSFGTALASWMMLKNGRAEWEDVKWLMLAAFVGSAVGAWLVQSVDFEVLSFLIPVVLIAIALYFLLAPQPQENASRAGRSEPLFRFLAVPVIGVYDGAFGPGTGSFFSLGGVSLRGQGLVDATAVAKTLNFATNVASLVIFVFAGKIVWVAGLAMIAGQAFGAWLGSHYLIWVRPQVLRWIVVTVCVVMIIRYGFSVGWFG